MKQAGPVKESGAMEAGVLTRFIKFWLPGLLLLAAATPALHPFQWPVTEPVLINGFAQLCPVTGGFYTGILVGARVMEVQPLAEGRILFAGNSAPLDQGGIGRYLVIEHDRGIRAIYGNLMPAEAIYEKREVGPDDVIGVLKAVSEMDSPEDGETNRRGKLYIKLIDGELDQIVNPLITLPVLSSLETVTIKSAAVEVDGDRVYSVPGESFPQIPAGMVDWYVEVGAMDAGRSPDFFPTPRSITLQVNAYPEGVVAFDALQAKEEQLRLAGYTVSEVYAVENHFYAGSINLAPGETEVEIIVESFSGDESRAVWRVQAVGAEE